MKRRNALAYLAVAIGGTAVLPGCWKEWRKESLPAHTLNMTSDQETLLAEVVALIIPEGEAAPGARSLGVDQFILTMVSDCSDKQAQEEFVAGFTKLEEATKAKFGKRFSALQPEQRLEALRFFLTSPDPTESEAEKSPKEFVSFVKQMTVQGYMNSEYVMTNVLHYKHIPGKFEGCAPVTKPAPVKA